MAKNAGYPGQRRRESAGVVELWKPAIRDQIVLIRPVVAANHRRPAQLAERAPRIRAFIDRCFAHLQTIHEESLANLPPVEGSAVHATVVGKRRTLR